MNEKLIIRNFGPIRDIELEFTRFNILIGEQATGKSTIVKLLSVCRYFSYIVGDHFYSSEHFENGLEAWGLKDSATPNTYIFYVCEHYSLTVKSIKIKEFEEGELVSNSSRYDLHTLSAKLEPKSDEFKHLMAELQKLKPRGNLYETKATDWNIPTSFFQNDVASLLDNPLYLPVERVLQSVFSLGRNSIQNISDSLFNQFAKIYSIVRLFKNETDIEPLDIIYKNENEKASIRKKRETHFYALNNAATGYQSAIPIVLLIKYYCEIRKKKKTFIIEEPEQSLFPTAQNKLMQFLVDKTIGHGNSTLLTTHSPYILTSLNNMLYAYQVGQENSEKVKDILPEKYWLNPKDVSVYMMLPDGSCENIFDNEEKLIKAEKIDAVSKILSSQFDDLLNIEFISK